MYNNSLGREIANQIYNLRKRNLDHARKYHLYPVYDRVIPRNIDGYANDDGAYFKGSGALTHLNMGYEKLDTPEPQLPKMVKQEGRGITNDIYNNLHNINSMVGGNIEHDDFDRQADELLEGCGFYPTKLEKKQQGKGILSDIGLGKKIKPKKEKVIKEKKPKKEKVMKGKGFLNDLVGVANLASAIGGSKMKNAIEIEGVLDKKGGGVVDTIKKVVKRGKNVVNAVSNIAKKQGQVKDLLNVLSLGQHGGKKKTRGRPKKVGGIASPPSDAPLVKQVDPKGETFMKPEERMEHLLNNGGAKELKKGGRRLVPRAAMPASNVGAGKQTWAQCIKNTKEQHPELKGLKSIIAYIKSHNLYKK